MSLKYSLLGLLSYQPMTGYDLKTIFDGSISHFWAANVSQIYRDLGELEKEGYTRFHIDPQKGRPDRKVYTITPAGEKAFQDWLGHFPNKLTMTCRYDFLVRVFFGSGLPLQEMYFQFQRLHRELQEDIIHMREVEAKIDKEDHPQEDRRYWKLTAKMGSKMALMTSEWVTESMAEIEQWIREEAVLAQLKAKDTPDIKQG